MKKIIISIAVIVLLILAYIFVIQPLVCKKTLPCQHQIDSLNIELNSLYDVQNQLNNKTTLADSLQKQLNECRGVMTPEEELAATKIALAEARAKLAQRPTSNRKAPARTATRSKTTVADVSEASFSGGNSFTVSSVTTTPASNNSSSETLYSGQMKGTHFTTIDYGYLMYGILKTLSPQAPRLNGVNGELFISNGLYWTYTDKNRLISVGEINSATETWTVYIGNRNYGTGSYPMFLPHEYLKTLIKDSRGYDFGAITSGDVSRMAQTNPLIGKSLIPNSSDGHSATDQNFYNGWSFKTKIVAVKKTTSIN